ncbi:MAG: zinc ribbon domain-containing protein, partial [Oscillospiraceae bacterium]|nr:zinc ribbon domain-containing protein [Oscillospiraceae bacterium]
MSVYCQNCGAELLDSANFCPQCGASVTGGGSGVSNAAKTAATVGGVVLGAAALENLAFRLSHRRRPM